MNMVTAIERPTENALVERAQGLIPSLRERAVRIGDERRMPEDVERDLYDADLMGLMRPERFGGPELSPDVVSRVGYELAKGSGEIGWVYMVTAASDLLMRFYPEEVQADYWGSELPVCASSYIPTGRAAPTEGGYLLSGKWSYCSGIDQAGWVMLGAIVGMLDEHRPDYRYFLVKKSDVKVEDDWRVIGMRGTGSKSVLLDEVFVPNARIVSDGDVQRGLTIGKDGSNHPDYFESVWAANGFCLVGPAPGIARNAYAVVVNDLKARIARRDPIFAGKQLASQAKLAEASVMIDIADMLITRQMDRVRTSMDSYTRINDIDRAHFRRDTCYAVKLCLEAGQLLMGLAGTSGVKETHPVQQALQDLYTISSHPAVAWDSPAQSFGSIVLGGPFLEGRI